MTPEAKIEQEVMRYLKSKGGHHRKCQWVGHRGAPDRFCMCNGRHWFMEFKAPGEEQRHDQTNEAFILTYYGGCSVWLVRSIEDGKAYIDEILGADGATS